MTAKSDFAGALAKFTPAMQATAKQVLAALRPWFRGADELIYNGYNALVVVWSPTGRSKEAICSIAIYPQWINLFFMHGPELPDPKKRLQGKGTTVRHVVLEKGAATVEEPAIRALLTAAVARSAVALDPKRRGAILIKSMLAKHRPRRPAAKAKRS